MKIFLDDARNPPDETWDVARTVRQAFDLMAQEHADGRPLEALSLDYDLGLTCPLKHEYAEVYACEHTNGLELVGLMQVYGIKARRVLVHSQNPKGRRALLSSIPLITVDPVAGSIPAAGDIVVPAPRVLIVRNEDR